MKLNKKIATKATAFGSTLLLTGICFSAQIDKEAISRRCDNVYNTLERMFEEQKAAFCAYYVQYAGWVMQGTTALVRSERYPTALKNLRVADGNLSRIYSKSQECAYFSPKVKPSLDEVKSLINELENSSN
ncbi:TPA: hypothetical protein GJ770_04120 [Legionella pneumophila]|nr:hypothetical protein [Legionella pneumophila]